MIEQFNVWFKSFYSKILFFIDYFYVIGAGSASNFETIYDSVKLQKSSGYVNQFKSVQNQSFDLKSDCLSLGKELGKK